MSFPTEFVARFNKFLLCEYFPQWEAEPRCSRGLSESVQLRPRSVGRFFTGEKFGFRAERCGDKGHSR